LASVTVGSFPPLLKQAGPGSEPALLGPTSSLDFRATCELREILRKVARLGKTIIMVTHNLPDLIPEINRIAPECEAIIGDLFLLHQKIKNKPVDLLIGNSYGKYIARAEDIPLMRLGFPITDRANLHYFPSVGYMGMARLVETIGNTMLDRLDRDADDSHFELIL